MCKMKNKKKKKCVSLMSCCHLIMTKKRIAINTRVRLNVLCMAYMYKHNELVTIDSPTVEHKKNIWHLWSKCHAATAFNIYSTKSKFESKNQTHKGGWLYFILMKVHIEALFVIQFNKDGKMK